MSGAVVTALGWLLISGLQALETTMPREWFAVVMFIVLIVFLFAVLPAAWWLTYLWLDRVMHGISKRMPRRDRRGRGR